jgi:hypothetical protein
MSQGRWSACHPDTSKQNFIFVCMMNHHKQYWLGSFFLKNTWLMLMMILIVFFFTACPFSTFRQLDDTPQIQVNPTLFGTWSGSAQNEVTGKRTQIELRISGEDDYHYKLTFIGFLGRTDRKRRPLLDTLNAKAFMSALEERNFLNVKVDGRTYLVELKHDQKDELTLLPLAEQFTSFGIRTNEDLKKVVINHFKTRLDPLYDKSFCLRGMKRVSQSIPD